MEAVQWAGAIDNVGGEMLTWLTRTVDFWGNIASIGLAGSHELHTTVMPFILRGVNLLGINSVATPRDVRLAVWERIATDLRPAQLDRIADKIVTFDELPAQFDDYIKGRVIGRTVSSADDSRHMTPHPEPLRTRIPRPAAPTSRWSRPSG